MERSFSGYVVLLVVVTLASILGQSAERELRPSDHGLAYQEDSYPPAQHGDPKEMLSFFGGATSVQLPEAQNISDTWSRAHAEGRARDVGKDHVRLGLLVASAVCGLAGVVLLVVSGVVLLLRLKKQERAKTESIPSTLAPTFVPQGN